MESWLQIVPERIRVMFCTKPSEKTRNDWSSNVYSFSDLSIRSEKIFIKACLGLYYHTLLSFVFCEVSSWRGVTGAARTSFLSLHFEPLCVHYAQVSARFVSIRQGDGECRCIVFFVHDLQKRTMSTAWFNSHCDRRRQWAAKWVGSRNTTPNLIDTFYPVRQVSVVPVHMKVCGQTKQTRVGICFRSK